MAAVLTAVNPVTTSRRAPVPPYDRALNFRIARAALPSRFFADKSAKTARRGGR